MDAHRPRRAPARSAALLVALLAVTACATEPPAAETPATPTDSHGIDGGGAAEVAAPARGLVVAGEDGAATLLDLETEERIALADARDDLESIQSDGRLLYRAHGVGGRASVEVIDTGRWTVPHGDHSHSFRGEPHVLGTLDGTGIPRVTAGEQRAALLFDGEVVTLAHDDLVAGLDGAPRVGVDTTGPVIPFAGHLLVPTDGTTIQVVDGDGTPVSGESVPCSAVTDADITRVGAVYSCAEGAVLFTRAVGGAIVGESIPLPARGASAMQLSGRTDRPDLAGVTADGAWLLDVRQRTWTQLVSEVPLVRAAAIGDDDGRTVAIDAEGCIRVLASDGAVLARTEPLVAASLADAASRDRVQLIVDGRYAYVSDPAGGVVLELDHRDDLGVTRTFTDLDPWLVELVG